MPQRKYSLFMVPEFSQCRICALSVGQCFSIWWGGRGAIFQEPTWLKTAVSHMSEVKDTLFLYVSSWYSPERFINSSSCGDFTFGSIISLEKIKRSAMLNALNVTWQQWVFSLARCVLAGSENFGKIDPDPKKKKCKSLHWLPKGLKRLKS